MTDILTVMGLAWTVWTFYDLSEPFWRALFKPKPRSIKWRKMIMKAPSGGYAVVWVGIDADTDKWVRGAVVSR